MTVSSRSCGCIIALIVTTGLWTRSYFANECLAFKGNDNRIISIESNRGMVIINWHCAAPRPDLSWWKNGFRYFRSSPEEIDLRIYGAADRWLRNEDMGENQSRPKERFVVGLGLVGLRWETGLRKLDVSNIEIIDCRLIVIPYWISIALILFLLVFEIRKWAGQSRIVRAGRCTKCGYDRRFGGDICPECGAACKAADPAGVSPAAGN